MINISENKIKQFLLWLLAYSPIFFIILFRALDDLWIYSIIFLIISIVIYFFGGNLYLKRKKKRISENDKKIGTIKTYETLPISEYSYFILTLFMPILFEDINTKLDYTVFVTLLILILFIFTKNDYIIINPLFLFGNFKVYKVNIKNIDIQISGYAIISKEIDLDKDFYYKEIFNNVYFIFDEVENTKTSSFNN